LCEESIECFPGIASRYFVRYNFCVPTISMTTHFIFQIL
jgi:hypothetical protein